MNRTATGLCALVLGLGLLTACNESRPDRMGERPGERMPSASPPSDSTTTTPSSDSPSNPSGTGTR
jgi:hypothetical protein